MICCKRILSLCAVLGASLLFTGCGYRIGARSLMHPDVKSSPWRK